MRRKLFTLTAGVSAVLFVGVCVLWFHSSDRWDDLGWAAWHLDGRRPAARMFRLCAADGRIWVSYERMDRVRADLAAILKTTTPEGFHARSMDLIPLHGFLSRYLEQRFVFGAFPAQAANYRTVVYEARAPGWALAGLTAIMPLWWSRRWIVRAFAGRGAHPGNRCSTCGYDLRATPDRCPECGAVAGKGTATSGASSSRA